MTFEPFAISVERGRGVTLVGLSGEFDLAAAEEFRQQVWPLMAAAKGGSLVIDLRKLVFMDSSGIRSLLELDAESRRDGFELVVVRGTGPVGRAIELTSLDELIRMVDEPPVA